MGTIDSIRNSIIGKLLTIKNKEYLAALHQLIENSSVDKDEVELTKEQKIMLELSDDDIQNKDVITQEQLDKNDLQWLKEL